MNHSGHNMMTSTMVMVMNTTMNHMHHVMNTSTMNHAGMDHGDHTTMDHSGHGSHGSQEGGTDHSMHGNGSGHTMKMYFHTGESEYILFQGLLTTSAGGMVGACFAMFALSVMYEGLKYFREYLLRKATVRSNVYAPSAVNGTDAIVHKQPEVGSRMLSGSHGLQTILHMLQVFVSYCLMLVFMTYNVWLCLSIILGAGLGYFLFGWRRAMVVDLNEHCH